MKDNHQECLYGMYNPAWLPPVGYRAQLRNPAFPDQVGMYCTVVDHRGLGCVGARLDDGTVRRIEVKHLHRLDKHEPLPCPPQ